MNDKLKQAIGVLKYYRKGNYVGYTNICEAIDTVIKEVDSQINIENTDCVLFGKCGFAISNYPGCWEDCKHFKIKNTERPLPTDEKTVCPECLKKCTNEELKVFGGLCEECCTDLN